MKDLLVRLKKGKKTYEVIVFEGMVAKFREGSVTRIEDVVTTPIVFTNSVKGERASGEQLKESFETDDMMEVLKLILEKGEAQEGASERKEKMDAKRQEIITYIQKAYVAADGSPLPLNRIENALEKVRPRLNVDQNAERQVDAMYAKLSAVMAMKRKPADLEGTVFVPVAFSGAVSGIVRKHATVLRESYGARVKYELEIHAYDQLLADLAKVTKGDYEVQLDTNAAAASAAPAEAANEEPSGGRRGKGKKKKKK